METGFHPSPKLKRIGRYEVLAQLTTGGMSELFLVSVPGNKGKRLVIKRILPDAKENDQFVRMFLDEARISSQFFHENIARVYEFGEDVGGLFMAMEYVAGQNLNQITAACARETKPLPLGFSAAVVHDVARALQYAHAFKKSGAPSPVIHRDVAHKNIMVAYEGSTKLLDFGIAKAKGSLSKTTAGMVKGTTGYMSPEQVRGETLDGRSDVFSLGVVLFELATGHRLFSAETEIEEMRLILNKPIPNPREMEPLIPESLSGVIVKALERDVKKRYQSADSFAQALERECGALLFNSAQRAAFMHELFKFEIARTNSLLDVPIVAPGTVLGGIPTVKPEDPETIRQAPVRIMDTRENRSSSAAALVLIVGILAVGAAVFFFIQPTTPDVKPDEPAVPGIPVVPMTALPEPSQPPPAPAPEPVEEPPRPSKTTPKGKLALFTIPPKVRVFKGSTELGLTPLNVQLPVGSHALTLVGPDGDRRSLNVRLKAKQSEVLKLHMDDLPRAKKK